MTATQPITTEFHHCADYANERPLMHLWISIRLTGAEIKWMGGGKGGYLHRFQSNHSNPFISSIKLHLFIFPSLFSPLSLSLSPSPFRFQTLLNASINLFRISFFLSGFFISWAIPSVINTHGGPVSASPASPSVAQRSHQLFKVQTTASNPLNPKIILPPPSLSTFNWLTRVKTAARLQSNHQIWI